MPRKRNSSSEGGVNLDSLMDALTNVVAVLILVLILVQADVTQKVQTFLENLRPATVEEVAASRQTVAKLEEERERMQESLIEEAPTEEEVEEERRQLALLEENISDKKQLVAELEELKKLEEELRPQRDMENEKTAEIQKEIADLEALLDETRRYEAPAPAVVTIPQSRPIPKNTDVYYAMVLRNRIHLIDPITPLEKFQDEFDRHERDWVFERIERAGEDRIIYDQEKIAAHFKNFEFPNPRNQKVELRFNPSGTRLNIFITPDVKEGGTAEEEMAQGNSAFANALNALSRNRRTVLIFQVNPDSFSTYLQARAMADDAEIPAGWEVATSAAFRLQIPDIEVNRLEDPPERDDTKPKPPTLDPKLD
ncbi:MAG: hypothetical protein AAGA58_14910 [Verrucomicrobiota bacterium]